MSEELERIGLTIGGILASREALNKLLGPTAEYFGESTKELVQKSVQNIGRIFSIAWEKLGNKVNEKGKVNSRVLKNIWDEGKFVEDVFAAEYFGGLLASSRSADNQDDTALPYINMIKNMSSNQLYLHFIIYSIVARLPFGREKPEIKNFWDGLIISIPIKETIFKNIKNPNYVKEAVLGLTNVGLLRKRYSFSTDSLKVEKALESKNGWIKVCPNEFGAELFLKVLGYKNLNADVITSVHVDSRISKFMKDSFELPTGFDWEHEPIEDPLDNLKYDLESRIDDIESKVDDIEEKVDEIDTNASEQEKADNKED